MSLPPSGSRQLGTATRLTTGMNRSNGGSGSNLSSGGRKNTSGGSGHGSQGTMLNQSVRVEDRPITQQGLGGLKTSNVDRAGGMTGSKRQIEDKSYFLGVVRAKQNELQLELNRMAGQIVELKQENANYVQYEQMAERLAGEIKSLQGELGDYNTLMDKMNTEDDANTVQIDYEELMAANEKSERLLDSLFEEKNGKEAQLKSLDVELEQERRMADNLVANMPGEMRKHYMETRDLNRHLLEQLTKAQNDIDKLNLKKVELEDELATSNIRQEALRLYKELYEVETKRDQLKEEEALRGNPEQERERLLQQVKEDNQEISTMERQLKETQEKLSILMEELDNVDRDIDDNQSERMQKIRDLKKREEHIDEFMKKFETNRASEMERTLELEKSIVTNLEQTVETMNRLGTNISMIGGQNLNQMKEQLDFKSNELVKSEGTVSELDKERQKLQQDLMKIDHLDSKLTNEKQVTEEKITKLQEELELYSDLDKVRNDIESKKNQLSDTRDQLTKRKESMRRLIGQMSHQYEAEKDGLESNDTQVQLTNLEKKWQHQEQNNFVMKEFIATKSIECDYQGAANIVMQLVSQYNEMLTEDLKSKTNL